MLDTTRGRHTIVQVHYTRLKADLLAHGQLFQDPNFKPNNNSIYLDGAPRSVRYGRGPIAWKRPHVSRHGVY